MARGNQRTELRQRRPSQAEQPATDVSTTGAAAVTEEEYIQITPAFYLRQHSGLACGFTACAGTVLSSMGERPAGAWAFVAWLMLALVALILHETRPYRGPGLGELFKAQPGAPAAAGSAPAHGKSS